MITGITKSKNEVIDKFESKALAITEYIDAKINKLEEFNLSWNILISYH